MFHNSNKYFLRKKVYFNIKKSIFKQKNIYQWKKYYSIKKHKIKINIFLWKKYFEITNKNFLKVQKEKNVTKNGKSRRGSITEKWKNFVFKINNCKKILTKKTSSIKKQEMVF